MNVRRVVFGSAMMTGGHAIRVTLQALLLPFLAVRLGPVTYGLVALTMPVVFLALLLGGGGLGVGLVRNTDVAEDVEVTVFWFSLVSGAGLAAILFLFSQPIGVLLGEPKVAPLLQALSPIVLLSLLCTVPQARLTRTGRLHVFAASDLASTLTGMATAFFGAWHGWGAWSLVAQQLVLWSTKFCIVFAASQLRLRFVLVLAELRTLLAFGVHLVGSNLVDFCTRNADVYFINMSSGIRDLGYYALALQIVRLPETVLVGPIFTSLFPILAEASRNIARTARLYLAGLRVVALITLPGLVGLGLIAHLLVVSVMGQKWALTGTLLVILVPVGLTKCLSAVNTALFLGVGRSNLVLRIQLANSAAVVGGIAIGANFGAVGVAFGYAAMSLAMHPVGYIVACRSLDMKIRRIATILGPAVVATSAMVAGVAATIAALRPDVSPAALLAISVTIGVAVYAASLAAISGRQLYAHFRILRAAS